MYHVIISFNHISCLCRHFLQGLDLSVWMGLKWLFCNIVICYGLFVCPLFTDHQFNLQAAAGKPDRKDAIFSRFSTVEQTSASKSAHRPSKRQRFGNDFNASENGDASSDSDKESSLTAYYSGAITLANSPEERKRRENRSKRFEKGNGQRAENHYKPKSISSRNLYARRATAFILNKSSEDGGSRAVEDIDWDALTVKGTCQEIEKRYLRLTSAPDPSTVIPLRSQCHSAYVYLLLVNWV